MVERCDFDDSFTNPHESKRKIRNESEKRRRDALNHLITELASMITANDRKLDKLNVLKNTVDFLEKQQKSNTTCGSSEGPDSWKPSFLTNEEFCGLILEGSDAFFLVISSLGDVLYVSESVFELLGHTAQDLAQSSIFDIVDAEGTAKIKTLISQVMVLGSSNNACHRFSCTLKQRDGNFVPINVVARFKQIGYAASSSLYSPSGSGDTLCMVCVCEVASPDAARLDRTVMALRTPPRVEFVSRLNMEWIYIFSDERTSALVGYSPFDLLGTNGYDYVHNDDLDCLVDSHQILMQTGKSTSPPYRFLTKGNYWHWLQTEYYITYSQWNSRPEFVVATSRAIKNPHLESDASPSSISSAGSNASKFLMRSSSVAGDHGLSQSSRLLMMMPSSSIQPQPLVIPASDGRSSKRSASAVSPVDRKVFRPSPGVSIEHGPLTMHGVPVTPHLHTGPVPPRKSTLATLLQLGSQSSPGSSPITITGGTSSECSPHSPAFPSGGVAGADAERRLATELSKKQADLERKIIMQERELTRLMEIKDILMKLPSIPPPILVVPSPQACMPLAPPAHSPMNPPSVHGSAPVDLSPRVPHSQPTVPTFAPGSETAQMQSGSIVTYLPLTPRPLPPGSAAGNYAGFHR